MVYVDFCVITKAGLWTDSALVEAVHRNYQKFPKEIQNELHLKRISMLVPEEWAKRGCFLPEHDFFTFRIAIEAH